MFIRQTRTGNKATGESYLTYRLVRTERIGGKVRHGTERRACAQRFVQMVSGALDGQLPLMPVNFLESHDLRAWLSEFPDHAQRGSGLGDLSIVHDWQRLCHQNRARRVYIWSLDNHLAAYDRAPEL